MKKIDTNMWQEFVIKDIFDTEKKGGKIQVPTGASVPQKDLEEYGLTPRISVTGLNNGVQGMYNFVGNSKKNYRVYQNFISVSFLGTVFYQKEEASLDMKVHCLKPREISLNEYTGQFLISAIKASLRKCSYADQISSTVLPELTISLPQKEGKPDWEYMEQYMQSIEMRVNASVSALNALLGGGKMLNISKFAPFKLYDDNLFTIDSGTKLDRVRMTNTNPQINFVGRANANNGITDFIDKIEGVEPYNAGNLTLSLGGEYLGSCFVQEKEFYTSQNVVVLIPRHPMSDYSKRFIATMIFREGRLHYKAFIDELNRHVKTDFTILLPITESGTPDWKYMDSYMQQMELRVKQLFDKVA